MSQEFYSVEQVAALLGLHVKTVRAYVRDGRLKATRIGKQYRVMREDLNALTGANTAPSRMRHVEVSTIVQIEAVSPDLAMRATTAVTAAVKGRPADDAPVRIDTIYDEVRARLKIIVTGGLETTTHLLRLIDVVTRSAP